MIATFVLIGLLLTSSSAFGQTFGWGWFSSGAFGSGPGYIFVSDLDALQTVYSVTAPSGICVDGAAMSPDRRSYFVLTGAGIARFDVRTRQFVELIPGLNFCGFTMVISPDQRHWHFYSTLSTPPSYRIIDAITRQTIHEETGIQIHDLKFSADGLTRFEIRRISVNPDRRAVRAVERIDRQLWQVTPADGAIGFQLLVAPTGVYVGTGNLPGDLVRLSVVSGEQLAQLRLRDHWGTIAGASFAIGPGRLLAAANRFSDSTLHLGAFDLETVSLIEQTSRSAEGGLGPRLILKPDGASGYLVTQVNRSFNRHLIDTQPLRLGSARLSSSGFGVDIEENRKPEAVRLAVAEVMADRVRLTWSPSMTGPIPTAFAVLTRLRGPQSESVSVVDATAREWLSPPLLSGSYEFSVFARNGGGDGPASNQVLASVGESTLPGAPGMLMATTRDDFLRLDWQPPAFPAVSGYVIEAAPAASGSFAPVTRVSAPEFVIGRAPAGQWRVRVRAVTAGGTGPPSNEVTFTTRACTAAPAVPMALATTTVGSVVTLKWTGATTGGGVEEYVIEATAAPSATNWTRAASAGVLTSFQSPAPVGMYLVRIRARNACGESAPSNEALVIVP